MDCLGDCACADAIPAKSSAGDIDRFGSAGDGIYLTHCLVHLLTIENDTYCVLAARAAQASDDYHQHCQYQPERERGQGMMEQIRVVLVDDHRVVRQGLRTYLESFPDLTVVGEASSGEETLRHIELWLPDVVVMDLLMPGGMDGVETIRQVRRLTPHTQIIALTSYTDNERVIAVLRAGAIGYVRKDAAPDVLLAAVRAAAHGQSLLDPSVAGAVLQELSRGEGPEVALSEREQEVLRQLALGHTNREIAETMMVSPETVKTHVGNILAKLHLAHRTQAVIYALKRGIISLDDIDL